MASERSWKQKFRYRFENFMSRGGASIFLSLVIVFIGIFTVIGVVRALMLWIDPMGASNGGAPHDGFFRHLYVVFLEMTDPGNMNQDLNSVPGYKFLAILAGIAGVVIFSMLIAFITTALDRLLQELRKGHSDVVETNHTLILGWNERVTEIIRELVLANESEENPSVVILAEREKEEMDDYLNLHLHLRDRLNTRVVTRSGNTSILANLQKVAVEECKSVIVLANCRDTDAPEEKSSSDAKAIKTILGVLASRPEGGKEFNIVAEIFDAESRRIVEELSPEEITTIDTRDILAKILVQTSRSSGLSVVYSEMLSFDGCEMYFHQTAWNGATYGQSLYRFPDGIPMGIRHEDGTLSINPADDTVIQANEELLVLADDDSTIEFRKAPVATVTDLPLKPGRIEQHVEKELLIGWTPKANTILREYGDYVLDGTVVDVVLRKPSTTMRSELEELDRELTRVRVNVIDTDPMKSENLLALEPWNYDNIIILSQGGDEVDPEKTDSETIIILLLLRKIFDERGGSPTKLITEVMDSANQGLIARTGVNDFIISNRLVSMILAQISEESDIKRVYDDLFAEDGSEIYLKDLSVYSEQLPLDVSYADCIALARKREEVCLGIKQQAFVDHPDRNYGVTLIPEKNTRFTLGAGDALVVLAEDDT
jgi:hypothetical protein